MSATFLPNKPMMLAAGVMRWIARPAHCGSISASRWAASDEQRATSGKANCGPVVTSVGRFM